MVTLLSRLFIRTDDEQQVRKAYGTLCSLLGIMLNIMLFIGKYFAGVISGSIAITADAFNNLSDAGSSFITLVGFWFAGMKPDPEHPFGHGRFEYISGFVISIVILFMGAELMQSSIKKIINPEPVEGGTLAMVILLVSICVKLYMCFYNHRIGKRIDSSAMKATALDSLSDSVATTVVLISMLLARFLGVNVDGICGAAVALFILCAGCNAAKDTMNPLLGTPPEKEFVEEIERLVMAHDMVSGIHDLVVHNYGPGRVMISLHAEIPGDGNIYHIHEEIDGIERELKEKLGCEAVIHMDPIETDNQVVNGMKVKMEAAVRQIHEGITIHDFRMVQGPSRTNLIFDIVVPYELKLTQEELVAAVQKKAFEINENYIVIITVDKAYI